MFQQKLLLSSAQLSQEIKVRIKIISKCTLPFIICRSTLSIFVFSLSRPEEYRRYPRLIWTFISFSIFNQTLPTFATLSQIYLETILYERSLSSELEFAMATEFWQACFCQIWNCSDKRKLALMQLVLHV